MRGVGGHLGSGEALPVREAPGPGDAQGGVGRAADGNCVRSPGHIDTQGPGDSGRGRERPLSGVVEALVADGRNLG